MYSPSPQGPYSSPQAAYKQASVETASPEKLVAMLYGKTVVLLRQAEKAIAENKYEECHNSLSKVRAIICELNRTLDMEQGGEIAENLRKLYDFYYMEVVKANVKKDAAFLQPAISFFESLRDIWLDICRNSCLGAK